MKVAEAGVDSAVSIVVQDGLAEKCIRPCVFENLTDGEIAREEGVDFRRGLTNAGLDVED